MIESLKVIIPKTQKDFDELKKLDEEGLLVSGASYPTKEQLDKISIEEVNKE